MIIGICGPKGSGKSTLAGLLVQQYQYRRVAFADPIKEMLKALLNYQTTNGLLIYQMIQGDLKEQSSEFLSGASPRWAMQTLGTEWGRNLIHEKLWINTWKNKAHSGLNQVVCDDVRFKNEAKAIKELGGRLVRVMRPGTNTGLHSSEREYEQIDCDLIVYNDEIPQKMLDSLTDVWEPYL